VWENTSAKSINLNSKSAETGYSRSKFDSLLMNQCKKPIRKFGYSIASDIYKKFEFSMHN
jgi:hypothetical protein